MKNGTYYARNFEMWINAKAVRSGDEDFQATLLPAQPKTTIMRSGTLQLDQLCPDAQGDSVRCIGCYIAVRLMWGERLSQKALKSAVKTCIDRHFSEFEGQIDYGVER